MYCYYFCPIDMEMSSGWGWLCGNTYPVVIRALRITRYVSFCWKSFSGSKILPFKVLCVMHNALKPTTRNLKQWRNSVYKLTVMTILSKICRCPPPPQYMRENGCNTLVHKKTIPIQSIGEKQSISGCGCKICHFNFSYRTCHFNIWWKNT